MDPLQQYLAEASAGEMAPESGEFKIDRVKLVTSLAEYGRRLPKLSLLHLLQALSRVEMEEPPWLKLQKDEGWSLRFRAALPEHRGVLTPEAVYQKDADLLGRRLPSRVARALVESGPGAALYAAEAPRVGLQVVEGGAFELRDADRELQEGEVEIQFAPGNPPFARRLKEAEIRWQLGDLAGFLPWSLGLEVGDLSCRSEVWAWPRLWPEDDEPPVASIWDWEAVARPKPGLGFHWSLPNRLVPKEDSAEALFFVEERLRNSWTEAPLLLHLEDRALAEGSAEDGGATTRTAAGRIFGVSWNVSTPQVSRIIPILEGVPGEHLLLPDIPRGLFCCADASELTTDLSGLALRDDERTEQWKRELLEWMRAEVKLYYPEFGSLIDTWLERSRKQGLEGLKGRLEGIGRGLSALVYGFLRKLYASAHLRRMIERRAAELERFVDGSFSDS